MLTWSIVGKGVYIVERTDPIHSTRDCDEFVPATRRHAYENPRKLQSLFLQHFYYSERYIAEVIVTVNFYGTNTLPLTNKGRRTSTTMVIVTRNISSREDSIWSEIRSL